jgi:hypothetical protein
MPRCIERIISPSRWDLYLLYTPGDAKECAVYSICAGATHCQQHLRRLLAADDDATVAIVVLINHNKLIGRCTVRTAIQSVYVQYIDELHVHFLCFAEIG